MDKHEGEICKNQNGSIETRVKFSKQLVHEER